MYYSGLNKKIKRELTADLGADYEWASSKAESDHLLMTNKFPETSRVRRLEFKIICYVDKINRRLHVSSPFSYLYNKLLGYVSDNSALYNKFS
jgi:hypothetical protein